MVKIIVVTMYGRSPNRAAPDVAARERKGADVELFEGI